MSKSGSTHHATFGQADIDDGRALSRTQRPQKDQESSAPSASDDPPSTESVPEYLEKNVMMVLTEGLEDLCRQRPANPVDHLALFLLRHSRSSTAVEADPRSTVPAEPAKKEN
uniref:Dpy-30 motif containing protein n=1 Tax=Trypanosoma congolense (strain IL3000) TaxID=1068625 RepID=G0UR01_TRYCI|nr:conserved hypothetical protein [Trypanosoma congolense IL3000]